MPTTTYTPLANITLTSSSSSSFSFTSISQAYRDLVLVASFRGDIGGQDIFLIVNGNTTDSSYTKTLSEGAGGGSIANITSNPRRIAYYSTINTTANNLVTMNAMDYSATNKNKTILIRNDRSDSATGMIASTFNATTAITSLGILLSGGSLVTGSTFALYGVVA